jgi:hypothetical protein
MCEDVEAWTFEQNEGEAVLIPAGCSYQVRNLKVHFGALDLFLFLGRGTKFHCMCILTEHLCASFNPRVATMLHVIDAFLGQFQLHD